MLRRAMKTSTRLPVSFARPRMAAPLSSSFHATSQLSNLAALKELRAVSGAPMMECKKALDASDSDMEKALDWLRRECFNVGLV